MVLVPASRSTEGARRVATAIACLAAVTELGLTVPALAFLVSQLGGSASMFALVFAAFMAAQLLSASFWARLSDQRGRRPVLIICVAGSSLAMLGVALAPSLAWVLVARATAGLFGGTIAIAAASVTDLTRPNERAAGLSHLEAAVNVGIYFIGPLVGGTLATHDVRLPFFLSFGLGALNATVAAVLLTESRVGATLAEPQPVATRALMTRPMVALFVAGTALAAVDGCYHLRLKDEFGFTSDALGRLIVFYGAVLFIMQRLVVGRLIERLGTLRAASGAMGVCALAKLGFGLIGGSLPATVPMFLGEMLLFGAGFSVLFPALGTWVSTGAMRVAPGTGQGVLRSTFSLGRLAAPMHGLLAVYLGFETPFFASVALFIISAALLAWHDLKSPAASR